MIPNPSLRKLGFADRDRLVILHADDIGMCHASYQAYKDLVEFGLISSGAVMVPCSWFPQVADYCSQNPHTDMGVHLTLTSEWNSYRWGPISTRDIKSGLIDREGYFYRKSGDIQSAADPDAAQIELSMQVERAISAGIDITHLDTHMNTVAHPKFIEGYINLALSHEVPLLFPRYDEEGFRQVGLDSESAKIASSAIIKLEGMGIPLVDHGAGLELTNPSDRINQAKKILDNLPPGITHFIIHPSIDTPELRAITPDWQCRVADYLAFSSEELRDYINQIGIHIIGYRALKQIFRSSH